MNRIIAGQFLFFLGLAVPAHAAVNFSTFYEITSPTLPNHVTYTITAHTDVSSFTVFDFGSGTNGITSGSGGLNQVNPSGLQTVFTDINFLISLVGANPYEDSQFLFNESGSGGVFALNKSESSSSLKATFTRATPFGPSVPLVQLVSAQSWFSINPKGTAQLQNGSTVTVPQFFLPLTNFPAVSHFAGSANPGSSVVHTFLGRDIDGTGQPVSWSNFQLTGPVPAIAPQFNYATHSFAWDTTGSPAGIYTARMNALVFLGTTATYTITVIPEPTTLVFVGGALALLSLPRRKRSITSA